MAGRTVKVGASEAESGARSSFNMPTSTTSGLFSVLRVSERNDSSLPPCGVMDVD